MLTESSKAQSTLKHDIVHGGGNLYVVWVGIVMGVAKLIPVQNIYS